MVAKPLENDNIYIMGVLREKLNIKPFYLNLRYSYEEKNYLKWLQGHGKQANVLSQPLPYLFVRINTKNLDWRQIYKQLWSKTIAVHAAESSDVINTTAEAFTSTNNAANTSQMGSSSD